MGSRRVCFGAKTERAPAFNERAELESLLRLTKTLALFAAEWCGVTST